MIETFEAYMKENGWNIERNEWERISLGCAEGDTKWESQIRKFWDNHLPIVMSVKDGYSYYAIAVKDGSIVHGTEPEFEECEMVCL